VIWYARCRLTPPKRMRISCAPMSRIGFTAT
jgi:hypothetical protein